MQKPGPRCLGIDIRLRCRCRNTDGRFDFREPRTVEKDADTVAVSVRDNGCGMSAETLKHIFEPFFTTKKQHGTGLGLSITYGIVKRMGGEIEVTSKEGEGTTFNIYLQKKATSGPGE